ncbi:hypothetical protein O3M35_009087 [Rhynocoris fuscipes]|uniref:BTB domain-containing protein n=1 Tax=Rhynocoris fuscipes TaxID=488301 RepID=A0AAW1D3X3_9HEMI
MKHVETKKTKGQNVGIDKQYQDYPVSLNVYTVRNSRQNSSDEDDDPFNILRGKPYPNDERNTLYVQEKFTMPHIVIGLEDPNANIEKKSKRKEKKCNGEDVGDKSATCAKEHRQRCSVEGKSGKPGTKNDVDIKSNGNSTITRKENLEENGKKHKDNVEMKERRIDRVQQKVEDLNDAKELITKLVSKCRTFALDHMKREDTCSSLSKEVNNSKVRTIWEWKPKKELIQTGFKLDTSNLIFPAKVPNFIRLFQQFCMADSADIRIVIEDTVFHCHKIVLQCYSKFFLTQIRAKGFQKELMIEIPNEKVNKNVFMDIYIWMLNSPKNCKNCFTAYNVLNLLVASAYLKIAELENHCWQYVNNERNFDEASAFDLYWEARHANFWPVMALMIKRIKSFFLTLVQTDKFLKLSENEMHLLLESNNITVHSEIEVFFALIIWLRKKNQPEPWECSLFRLIRYSQMSPIQLVELQAMTELNFVTKHHPVSDMIENGIRVSIRREYAKNTHIPFNDPEPDTRTYLKRHVLYKSFNDFIDALIKKRSHMKKPNCNLIRREIMENFKINPVESWVPAKIVKR